VFAPLHFRTAVGPIDLSLYLACQRKAECIPPSPTGAQADAFSITQQIVTTALCIRCVLVNCSTYMNRRVYTLVLDSSIAM
jgi:hypothetical protein